MPYLFFMRNGDSSLGARTAEMGMLSKVLTLTKLYELLLTPRLS
jgi:hypothetical protein